MKYLLMLLVIGGLWIPSDNFTPCNYKDYYSPGGGEYFWRIYRVSSNGNRKNLIDMINANTKREGIWQIKKLQFTVTATTYSVVNDPLYYVVFQREPL